MEYYEFDGDGWVEDCVYETRYNFQRNGSENILGYLMTDISEIHTRFKGDEVICVFRPVGERLSRLD